jgi:alpha-1,3-rhamnosyl/mannosyltransferase
MHFGPPPYLQGLPSPVSASPTPIKPLTIGIDARSASRVLAGRGRVVRELLLSLRARDDPHRYRLYTHTAWEDLGERFTWVELPVREPRWHLLTARRASRECDVFLSTDSYLTAWFTSIPIVVLVHDLVAFDRSLKPRLSSAVIERATAGRATRRAAAFIAVSQATADALLARFARCRGRVTVARLGATRVPARAGNDRRDGTGPILAVGTLEPRKNLPRLVEAFKRLPEALQREHRLAVVGSSGWTTGPTLSALDSLGERAELLGAVTDVELAALYRGCAVFCYPSLGEGFGLPVLEAMSAGAPVVTSNVSSMPEVGGDAVEYVDPRDVESIAAGLRRVLENPQRRAELSMLGPRRAALFSWSEFAATALGVLEAAVGAAGDGATPAR